MSADYIAQLKVNYVEKKEEEWVPVIIRLSLIMCNLLGGNLLDLEYTEWVHCNTITNL